jgi:hypothetical protein
MPLKYIVWVEELEGQVAIRVDRDGGGVEPTGREKAAGSLVQMACVAAKAAVEKMVNGAGMSAEELETHFQERFRKAGNKSSAFKRGMKPGNGK